WRHRIDLGLHYHPPRREELCSNASTLMDAATGGSGRLAGQSRRQRRGDGERGMEGWTETWRGIVAPWECDITEHFTIAYYFDRLGDAASTIAADLGFEGALQSGGRRFDVRFVRELRAGASFHILNAPTALDEASLRIGHQFVDSANGEVTAWVEETLHTPPGKLPGETREVIGRRLVPWPGPTAERRPEPSTFDGFIPTARDRVKPMDVDPDGNLALAPFVHRFTAGCMQALAAIGA